MLMLGLPIESADAAGAAEAPLPLKAKAAPAPAAPATSRTTSHFLLLCAVSPGEALVLVTDTLGGGAGTTGTDAPE